MCQDNMAVTLKLIWSQANILRAVLFSTYSLVEFHQRFDGLSDVISRKIVYFIMIYIKYTGL
jgi:hypothetical protein